MTEKLEIYSATVCPFAQRTLIALKEKNIAYQLTEIDLDNRPDWFLKISPYGKVPLLKHQNNYIYESSIINEYIEEVFPTPALLAEDAVTKAHMRIWIAYCNSEFIPVFYKLLFTPEEEKHPELREALIKALYFIEHNGFGKFSDHGDYFFGSKLSLVDITYYPFFERFILNEYYRDIKIPDDCKRIRQWIPVMRERSSIKETANSSDFYIKKYAKFATGDNSTRQGYKKIVDDLWQ
jgi:glutathione S-transferase